MFRRSSSKPSGSEPASGATPGPRDHGGRSDLAEELTEAGWLLPRGLRDRSSRWSLVGTVSSPVATAVDPAGQVVGEGWSLDWWVGGDDRWRMPTREPSVRQTLLGDAPVTETVVRVPGGDAAHRVFGIRSPRPAGGDEWVVVEIENRTSVPFASVLLVRPFVADAVGSVGEVTLEPVDGGRGRDVAHLVRVDGRPAVVLPRRPARVAVGNREVGDLLHTVTAGEAGTELVSASCPDGLATMAFIFPTPHTAVLRVVLPVGDLGDLGDLDGGEPGNAGGGASVGYPQVIPDAATVAAGWEVHRRGPRFEIPDQHVAAAVERARTHILLAHDGEAVRRDGQRSTDMELGATDVILEAFDLLDRPADVGVVVARWLERLATATPTADALALTAVSRHWLIHRVDELLDWLLPEVAAAVERLDRTERKRRIADPVTRWRIAEALSAAARMLHHAGQPDAAVAVRALEDRYRVDATAPKTALDDAAHAGSVPVVDRLRLASGTELDRLVAEGGSTSSWPGPGPRGRVIGHDLAASAALIGAVRRRLVVEQADGLALLPEHPDGWYGGGVEVHDLPTEWGRISYGIRWHGIRPALLWHLEPHEDAGPVRLTAPGLDPTWSTTEPRGDALLAEVVPPQGLKSLTIVAEHPDIDPAMRRPGDDPGLPPSRPMPDGGSFS